MTMSGRKPKPYLGGGAMENDDEYQAFKRRSVQPSTPTEGMSMKSKSTMEIYGWSIDGWKATALLYVVWLAPAGVVALFILRIKMTCG